MNESVSSQSTIEERRALDDLFSLIYEELRRLASAVRRSDALATLSSTGLVHEAWVRLKDSPSLAAHSVPHFKAIAARAMRQVLVDEARRRHAKKRGGGGEAVFVSMDDLSNQNVSSRNVLSRDARAESVATVSEFVALDSALTELARHSERQAKIVECRFFGGLSVAETAAVVGVSESAIERDWRSAKAWLAIRIRATE